MTHFPFQNRDCLRDGDSQDVLSERQLDLVLPSGCSRAPWIAVGARSPQMHEVLIIKRNGEGWMGMVAGLHNGRELVALVFSGPGVAEMLPMVEDGMDRRAGLTHWRPWPTVSLPSLVAQLA